MNIQIRLADVADIDTIVSMREARSAWLSTKGTDQWQVGLTTDGFAERVRDSINSGQTYVATSNGEVVGTIAIDTWSNPGLWSESEIAESVIIHRMITWPNRENSGIGPKLLNQANKVALHEGRNWVRLDAWTTNSRLHEYYRSAGFQHVRTVQNHTSKSTALFERQARLTLSSIEKISLDFGVGLSSASAGTKQHTYEVTDFLVDHFPNEGIESTLQVTPGLAWLLWADEEGSWFASRAGTGQMKSVSVKNGLPLEWLNRKHHYQVKFDAASKEVVVVLATRN